MGESLLILDSETEYHWARVTMAEDFDHKHVGLVATIIGATVLFIGLLGLIVNLS
jgi:hypothetical protein